MHLQSGRVAGPSVRAATSSGRAQAARIAAATAAAPTTRNVVYGVSNPGASGSSAMPWAAHKARVADLRLLPACCTSASSATATTTSLQELPPLLPLDDDFDRNHGFGDFANWLIPGHVMLGRYPYCEPSRCTDYTKGEAQLLKILESGITTFVSLQEEVPPQAEMTLAGRGGFLPYKATAELIKSSLSPPPSMEVMMKLRNPTLDKFLPAKKHRTSAPAAPSYQLTFLHFPIVDLGVPESGALRAFVEDLVARVQQGERLYIHCWGGRGRAGTVGACLLAVAYGVSADEALARVQRAFSTRMDTKERSPETDEQHEFVRAFVRSLGGHAPPPESLVFRLNSDACPVESMNELCRAVGAQEDVQRRANELMRLSSLKMPAGLGKGEVCRAAACLELAFSVTSHCPTPSRETFVRHGCTTKKVYEATYTMLQKALGVSARPPSITDVALTAGCGPLAQPAEALVAAYSSRLAARVTAAQHAGPAIAPSALRADLTSPAFIAAALHLTANSHGWKKGQVKLEVRKLLKGLGVMPSQMQAAAASITEVCGDLLGQENDAPAGAADTAPSPATAEGKAPAKKKKKKKAGRQGRQQNQGVLIEAAWQQSDGSGEEDQEQPGRQGNSVEDEAAWEVLARAGEEEVPELPRLRARCPTRKRQRCDADV